MERSFYKRKKTHENVNFIKLKFSGTYINWKWRLYSIDNNDKFVRGEPCKVIFKFNLNF